MLTTHRTPRDVADLWQCSTEHVLDLIRSGRLRGFSLSTPGSKRPRWRVSTDAIAEYESQHSAQVAVKPSRRQRRTKASTASSNSTNEERPRRRSAGVS